MQRSIALGSLVLLFASGCGTSPRLDTEAAREYVERSYSNGAIDITLDQSPEYAPIARIPRDHIAKGYPDRAAACGVRAKFIYKDDHGTRRDDWVVWVSSDHKAVGWSGNANKDNWRQFVQSAAKK
jgi:hypothetical protein